MCGIYGTTIKYSDKQIIDKLSRTAFRGPDKLGARTIGNNVIFGHNRLAVLDLDPRSDQPFSYETKIHIVFNGEIYNFQELKKNLTKLGYKFHTTSDTEVICALYLEYDTACVDKLNGMFSFVIYDQSKNKLFGARDRLGQKPFYYYHQGKDIEFSSQPSSIRLHNKRLTISSESITSYLTWGSVPDSRSIYNEVKKLDPGHILEFYLDSGSINLECYWDITTEKQQMFDGSYEDAQNELDKLLTSAVTQRMYADVPLGVFLSGGVDSSVIAGIASKNSTNTIKTFSVKFNEAEYDESKYAQLVADHLKTNHTVIECNYNEGIDLISSFSQYYDEPFADSSAIPSMLLAKHTRKKVTVALSGDAGDENFAGYHRYHWIKRGQSLHVLPYPLRLLGSKILRLAPHYRLKVIADAVKLRSINDTYIAAITGVDQSYIKSESNFRDVKEKKYLFHENKNLIERVTDFDIKTYLNWDINTKVDRATMAFSLEARAPLMDYRIVEFSRRLPTLFKYYKGNQKRILKDVLYNYVPKHIFDRPKAGFTMPFERWFREDLKSFVLDELNDEGLKSIPNIDVENVKFRLKQHMNGSWNRYPLIWKLLVLKQWLRTEGKGLSIK